MGSCRKCHRADKETVIVAFAITIAVHSSVKG